MKPRIYVIEKEGHGFLFRWKAADGKWKQKKSDARTRRSAERAARDLEMKMSKASNKSPETRTWSEFCDRYQQDHLHSTSEGNQTKWMGVRKHLGEYLESRNQDVTELPMTAINLDLLIAFESWLARQVGSPATVDSYLKTLRAGLSFAAEIEWIKPLPRRRQRGRKVSPMPKMRGRPVTGEEVDRLLWAVDKVLEKPRRQGFRELIKAYWYGGLRRAEPLDFHWTDDNFHRPMLDGEFPRVFFHERQKNRRNEIVAITKEFAGFLESIRKADGWVFSPLGKSGARLKTGQSIGRVMKSLAVRANVVLTPASDGRPAVYATAQNLRQGLAYRLHADGKPAATMKHVMRHADWKTTMEFYAGQGAAEAARDLRKSPLQEIDAASASREINSL